MDTQTSTPYSSSLDRFIGVVEDIVITTEFQVTENFLMAAENKSPHNDILT